jgi:Zn ribbon nucleic-acid-binding protein
LDVLRDILPQGNQISESIYEAKKIIYPLGIEVEKIHACKNSYVLFRGDYADLDKCPKCGYDRYKRKKDGGDDNNADDENVPGEIRGKNKANRGAPVRRWFATRKEAQLLRWHEQGRKELNYKKDGKFRHPTDVVKWGNINTYFPWFNDARSIQFSISTDGVNPFGNQSSTHSTWPVVLSLYNLPPWLCKKQKYMMLTILVAGTKQFGDRIDVYLRPLVDDLKILWKPGVPEDWDEYRCEEFTMHGMLFTTINDNPAHRNLSGQSKRKGAACPHCLEDTCAIWLRHLKIYVFMGHRRFLSKKHPH